MMLGLTPNLNATDEFPPAMRQLDDADEAFEAYLFYLAEFEDEKGDWVDPMSFEQNDLEEVLGE